MKERIQALLQEMNRGIYEKETEVVLALLAAIAGESIIILGPPGVAKSMVARRLKSAFRDARSFEYLMSRFSTPDEIFGPVSISKLKAADKYERSVDGYLPMADVVFLDEIWKAGPAIQNTLLTVMNEKLFRNGDKEIRVPMKLLIAASNELPAQGEGLEALWDRFIIRLECENIKQEQNFNAASKLAKQAKARFEAYIGYSYGKKKTTNRGVPKIYQELAGKEFWYKLTGDEDFYIKIIGYMGNLPEQYVEAYKVSYNKAANRLVREFSNSFCNDDGSINWEKLVEFNSGD